MDQDGESERRDKCKRGEKINAEYVEFLWKE
jgi:hypothetical protein